MVARLWAAAVPADASAGRVYLAKRFAWPPHGIGPDLPATVRWLAREAAPGRDKAARWYGLPDGAVGALVFAWRRPGDADLAPVAASMEALDVNGDRLTPRWRRTFGNRSGAAFEARAMATPKPATVAGLEVHVAEGEADALALSLAPWCGPGGVYAAGGTAGMRQAAATFAAIGTGPLVIYADGDRTGRTAALAAADAVEAGGRECRVEWHTSDPAARLAEWLRERAASREYEGGADREAADRGAWADLLQEATWTRN